MLEAKRLLRHRGPVRVLLLRRVHFGLEIARGQLPFVSRNYCEGQDRPLLSENRRVAIKGKWNDKGTLPIVCPACKRTTHESIAKLQQGKVVVCPGCGKTTQCTSDFLAAIKAL